MPATSSPSVGTQEDPLTLAPVRVAAKPEPAPTPQPVPAPRKSYRAETVNVGPLGDANPQDVPFTVTVVPEGLLRDTHASSTSEALRLSPSAYVSTGASEITPYFSIRGFSASPWTYNMAVDGMRSFDIYEPMLDKERVEILEGGNGALYGVTSPAGMVNYVLKRPTATPLHELDVGVHGEQIFGHLDLGGPTPGLPSLGYRLNAEYATAGDVGVNHQTQRRYAVSTALAYTLGEHMVASLDASFADRNTNHAQSLFMTSANVGIPDAPDGTANFGAPYTYAKDSTLRIGVGLQADFAEHLTLRVHARHSRVDREYVLSRQVWQNQALDYFWRVDQNTPFTTLVEQANAFVDADFHTAFLRHHITVGGSVDAVDIGNNGYRGSTGKTALPGNLYGTPDVPPWSDPPVGTSTSQETTYNTALAMDRISVAEKVSLLAGGTLARVNDSLTSRGTKGAPTSAGYKEHAFTPTLALSYKPLAALTTYASYIESLQQGFVAGTTSANAGDIFPPFVSRQIEVGSKATLGHLFLALALFRISSANQYLDPTSKIVSQDGRAVHSGVELTATGEVFSGLRVSGGATWLRARIDRAPSNQGKVPQGVPERMGRLSAEYDIPFLRGFALSGAVAYTGRIPWDAGNTLYVPAVVIFDAGARYRRNLGPLDTTFRIMASNVAGTDYWTTRAGILYPGAPRVITFSGTFSY